MAASAPSDAAVRAGIQTALETLAARTAGTKECVEVKPNKLRKIVCKQVEGSSWTQFQITYDHMVQTGELQVSTNDEGERVVRISTTASPEARSDKSKGGDNDHAIGDSSKALKKKETRMELPLAVAHHLTRKGRRKQKNIEQTTKTRLVLSETNAKQPSDEVTLTITREFSPEDSEDEYKAKRQMKAALGLIENMIRSYKEHPDRFVVKKAGGMLEEQEAAKKKREEAAKYRAERYHKRLVDEGERSDGKLPKKKKKQRKFY